MTTQTEADDRNIGCSTCNQRFTTHAAIREHDCTPTCRHCGATYEDLDDPDSEAEGFAIENHQRTCDERPESADQPIRDIEGEWREEQREKKRFDRMTRKLEREGVY